MVLYQSKKMMVAGAVLMALILGLALVAVLTGAAHGFLSDTPWGLNDAQWV